MPKGYSLAPKSHSLPPNPTLFMPKSTSKPCSPHRSKQGCLCGGAPPPQSIFGKKRKKCLILLLWASERESHRVARISRRAESWQRETPKNSDQLTKEKKNIVSDQRCGSQCLRVFTLALSCKLNFFVSPPLPEIVRRGGPNERAFWDPSSEGFSPIIEKGNAFHSPHTQNAGRVFFVSPCSVGDFLPRNVSQHRVPTRLQAE